ncbi:hypothetical protein OC835_000210 [Tilletia horrida]|nr:hypothetical protein OC835_000210 [Tilletia horrida]
MKAFSLSTWLIAGTAVLSASGIFAAPAPGEDVSPAIRHEPFPKRGEVHDIMSTISRKGKCGKDFCSTFLPPVPPKTTTITITKTVSGTNVPSSTRVITTAITKTASPAVTRTNSQLSVVAVTPTVSKTVIQAVPSTSTVATVTSFATSTVTSVVSTVTSFTANPPLGRDYFEDFEERNAPKNKVPIPAWLKPHCSASISKACSAFVSTKTCTKTAYVTKTKHCTKGVATVVKTNTVAVTPTTTVTVVSVSTSTASAVMATVKVTSSSLVGVTKTVKGTKIQTVPVTSTVLLPSPSNTITTVTTTPATTSTTSSSSSTTSTSTMETSTSTTDTSTSTTSTTTSSTTTTTSSTTTSSTPTPTVQGPVQGVLRFALASDGSQYGYLAAGNGAYGSLVVTQDITEAQRVKIASEVIALGGSQVDIQYASPQGYAYFGGTQLSDSGNGDLVTGSSNYATVANVPQAPAGQPGDGGTSYGSGIYESAIWNVAAGTGQITATWVNSNGAQVDIPSLLGQQYSSYLYLTPDPTAFMQTYGSFDLLNMYFVAAP